MLQKKAGAFTQSTLLHVAGALKSKIKVHKDLLDEVVGLASKKGPSFLEDGQPTFTQGGGIRCCCVQHVWTGRSMMECHCESMMLCTK